MNSIRALGRPGGADAQSQAREYAQLASFGIGVPQANPTVEPELWSLVPTGVSLLSTRLQGSRTNSENRLVDYLNNLKSSLDAFDTAPIDAFGFACTGTSYLVGAEDEARRLGACEDAFGYPIVSSAQAIRAALKELDLRRIALFAPYPSWLIKASEAYWTNCGLEIVSTATMPLDTADTRTCLPHPHAHGVRSGRCAQMGEGGRHRPHRHRHADIARYPGTRAAFGQAGPVLEFVPCLGAAEIAAVDRSC